MKAYRFAVAASVALGSAAVTAATFTYEQFGAVGDGKTDDRAAIVKTHEAANAAGASVRATDGKVYYLGPGTGTAVIKTDVDWGSAKFIIDDVQVASRDARAFVVEPSRAPFAVKDLKPFRKGAARLEVKLPCDCLLALEDANVRRYIRKGINRNDGFPQKEVLLVRRDGTVDPAAPVIWDFASITKATAYPIDEKPLTVKGGLFVTIANQDESKYTYHYRGIEVHRANTVLSGLRHEITGELDHGAPYGGFIQVRYAANVTVKDCVFTAHKLYWTPRHGGSSPMGSYDLTVNESVNTTISHCRQLTDIDDKRYWGLFASNYSKNIVFDTVEFSRFDAHMGVANATIRHSRLGHMGINAIGCGTFLVEDTEIRAGAVFNLRDDYGSTWEGEFIVRNCRLVPNGGKPAQAYLVRGSNAGDHDFGYVCRMPRRILFDGLVIDDTAHPKKYDGLSVFSDFNPKKRSADYEEKFPYAVTEEVVLKNVTTASGKPVSLCPNPYMFRTTKLIRAEEGTTLQSVLETVEVATGERKTVRVFEGRIEAPNWTRDGKWLIYNANGRLWRISPEGGAPEPVDTGVCTQCNNDHVLSFDGRSIAVSHDPDPQGSRVYILPLFATNAVASKALTPPCSYLHGWSPDGKTLAYCAMREADPKGDVYVVPAAGGSERRLTDAPGLDDGPEFSPCGKYIWFNSSRSGLMQVWRMRADGSEQRQMSQADANCWFPHVAPDGKTVVYLAYRKGDLLPDQHLPDLNVELQLMPADGGAARTLVRLFGGQGTINVNSWSPDSKRLAFVSYRRERLL